MENKKTTRLPTWVWVVGCLVIFGAALGTALLAGGLAAFLFVARQASDEVQVTRVAPAMTVELLPMATPTPSPDPHELQADLPATNTPPARPTEESSPEPAPAPSDPFAELREVIEQNVVEIRGLEPLEPVALTVLTTAELRQRLEEELAEEYGPEEAADDALVLSAFDFLSADFDLYAFVLDLYTEQIAGYYDPETAEFVVISDDNEFDSFEQWTHAHEYVHALQDQYYNLALLEDDSLDSEASLALRALAEGDATLVQTFYLLEEYLTEQEIIELFTKVLVEEDMSVLESAPPVLVRELEFPYIDGLSFVQTVFAADGFEGIDAVWLDPPKSTEQILHPERYFSGDEPQPVSLPPLSDALGDGWRLVDEDVFGELYLREYLLQQLPEEVVDVAATGWGGDRYAVYWHEGSQELIMVLALVWDTPADLAEFAEAYPGYPEGLFGVEGQTQPDGGRCWAGADVICLYGTGELTQVVRAPDLETAAAVAAVAAAATAP
jgi:hypothetical protein